MNLKHYLNHRLKYETLAVLVVLTLFAITNATTKILENIRDGETVDWLGAWASELSSIFAIFVLWPLILLFLRRLNLTLTNFRWRIFWHIPGFLIFSLLHIGLFVLLRKLLWALVGETYNFGTLGLNLLYDMRKDFLAYMGIMLSLYSYRFIITRLQGEAKFLSDSTETANDQEKPASKTQFLVKMLNSEFLVRVEEIAWIGSASNYVLMHCGDRSYPMRQTLTRLAEQLDPTKFMRVHRTAIVNLEHVSSLQEGGELQLQLKSGETVAVSKTYLAELKQALGAGTF